MSINVKKLNVRRPGKCTGDVVCCFWHPMWFILHIDKLCNPMYKWGYVVYHVYVIYIYIYTEYVYIMRI